MNSIFTKIILFTLGVLFLATLALSSFSWGNNNSTSLPDFWESRIWEYSYTTVWTWEVTEAKVDFQSIEDTNEKIIYEKNTDIFTSLYSNTTNYTITDSQERLDIMLWTGAYLINARTPFKEVHINAWGYQILLEKWWMIYVENLAKKSLVVSLNTVAELQFRAKDEIGASMYVYPHMYVWFKVDRFQGKTELDSLRLSQLATLWYFWEDFSEFSESNVYWLMRNPDFISDTLDIVSRNKKNNNDFLRNNIAENVDQIPWIEYIEKYFLLFYNERKKLVYHQNKILNDLVQLIKQTDSSGEVVSNIVNNLNIVKDLDSDEYIEMTKLIDNFSHLAFDNVSDDALFIDFFMLNKGIYWKDIDMFWGISRDFDRLNFYWEKTFYKKIQDTYASGLQWDENSQDYYLFFVRNIVLKWFEDENLWDGNFRILINIFNQYSKSLSLLAWEKTLDATKEITNILYNENILQAIRKALLSRYFGERNSKNLLTRTTQTIGNVSTFEEAVNNLNIYYTKGENLLQNNLSKYSKIINSYKRLNTDFWEYFSALNNYAQYQKTYSYEEISVISDEDDDWLSREKFIEYMSSFNGIDLNSIDVEITLDWYMVNNLSIQWRIFSFFLNPFRGDRIMDITVKESSFLPTSREGVFYNQLLNTTYEMDEEQIKYQKLIEKSKDEDREKFDFKNFFINNFFPQELSNRITCEEDINCKSRDANVQNDDEFIQLFKSATLLWDKWEFRNIRNILDVKYVNLWVTKVWRTDFDIVINNAIISTSVQKNKKIIPLFWVVNSEYELDWGHYFYNTILTPYERSRQWENEYLFKNIPVHIIWEIEINNFEDSMKKIFTELYDFHLEYKKDIQANSETITKIEYSMQTGEITFK